MHVEVPKSHSFKEFAGEYIMIVVSIITALALENGVHRYHQNHRAHEAIRNIDAELAANLAEVRSVIKQNQQQIDKTAKMKEILLANIKAGKADKEAVQLAVEGGGGRFGVNMFSPSIQREAWDVAVANQALTYVETERLKHYAMQYANMRDTQQVLANRGTSFMDYTQVANTFSSFELGEIDARSVYRVLTQVNSTHEATNSMLKGLEKLLVEEQEKTAKLTH
ncbi:hypothetical protein [Massilia sp. IC2-476]|uniref:hypothetical protein n=2 Tax=unclassified Massilia TaxID=2609279 RepID=UPI001D130152|nr:hypothetical protein [Massilia sp. IC2-476]MCC2971520.1 hypothetical protein [Massilia sp. IC2-476]